MTPTLLALGLATATIAVAGWQSRDEAAAWDWLDRLGALLALCAIITFWLLVVTVVMGTVRSDWNGARLAPIVALRYGYRLYYPATDGPILNHAYGPVAALAYLPAAVFRTPTPAILAGGALQVLFVFAPMLAFVLHASGPGRTNRPLALACGFGACLLLARYPGSFYWISMIHPDGPTLGLGLLACTALLSAPGTAPSTGQLLVSAAAATLACWTKQIAVPLPPALALAMWLAHGRAVGVRYIGALAITGALISGAFLVRFGEPMLFNMVVLMTRAPWYKPGFVGVLTQAGILVRSIAELLAALGVAVGVALGAGVDRGRIATRPWALPLIVAVFMFPTGAVGVNKLGGEQNSFHSVYYVIAGLAVLLAYTGRSLRAARALGYVFCVASILAAWRSGHCAPWAPSPGLWHNNQQVAYEFALRHPGEAYFPWHPLPSVLAEGRLYHFEYGILDRFLGGYEPTAEHVHTGLSPQLRWIAGTAPLWSFKYFPEYSEEIRLPELPGWTVRTRPSP